MISVIIPTFNRSALLERTLQSLLTQTISTDLFEVIVVDNNSTDDTKTVSENYSKKLAHFLYVKEPKPGLHECRHAGLTASNGTILTYTDDDIQACPEWLEAIYNSFEADEVGLVGGKALPLYESQPPDWLEKLWIETPYGKVLPYLSLIDFRDEVTEVDPGFIFGCNFSIRKDLLRSIGGFHPDGMPESLLRFRGDGETFVAREVLRLGYKSLYNYKASVNHWVPTARMTLDYLRKRLFMFGIANSYSAARSNRQNPTVPQIFVQKLRRFKRLSLSAGIQKELLKSFYEGFDFHQSELKKDPELKAWVFKTNYLS